MSPGSGSPPWVNPADPRQPQPQDTSCPQGPPPRSVRGVVAVCRLWATVLFGAATLILVTVAIAVVVAVGSFASDDSGGLAGLTALAVVYGSSVASWSAPVIVALIVLEVTLVLMAAVNLAIGRKLRQGRRWARVVTVLWCLTVVVAVGPVGAYVTGVVRDGPSESARPDITIPGWFTVGATAVARGWIFMWLGVPLVTLVLFCLPSARAWFRRRTIARTA